MSTHNTRFLWRNKQIYPIIIIKYHQIRILSVLLSDTYTPAGTMYQDGMVSFCLSPENINNKNKKCLDPLRAKKAFIRKMGHT